MPSRDHCAAILNSVSANRRVVSAIVMALCVESAHAADPVASMFSFSGFGTLGVAHSSEDRADFPASYLKPNGAGYTERWSFAVDSRIGAQVIADITPQLSAVLQVISEQRYDNSYTPTVEWANIKYQLTPDFDVRAGRIVLPIFLNSDYRKVGYAIPWVRPPLEIYGLVPISSSDGVDASYRVHAGEITNTLTATYGKKVERVPGGGTAQADDLISIQSTAEFGAATLRVTYLRTRFSLDTVRSLFDAFRQFGPQGIDIADKYGADNKLVGFFGLGASYEPGSWFASGEFGKLKTHSFTGDKTAWYVTGGYRIGDFVPYLTYARLKLDSNASDPGLSLAGFPPEQAAIAAGLNVGLNEALASPSAAAQKTVSVGGRWNFMKNVALKLQYDHTSLDPGSRGTLVNRQPDLQPGGKINVFSATVDFVF